MDASNFGGDEFAALKKGSRIILGGEKALRRAAEVKATNISYVIFVNF